MKVRLSTKLFVLKLVFIHMQTKLIFVMKSFAFSLAVIMRFTETRKWPIGGLHCRHVGVQNKENFFT